MNLLEQNKFCKCELSKGGGDKIKEKISEAQMQTEADVPSSAVVGKRCCQQRTGTGCLEKVKFNCAAHMKINLLIIHVKK